MSRLRMTPRKEGKRIKIGPSSSSFGATVELVNPSDRDFYANRYVISIGSPWSSHFLAYASDLESALEEVAEYCRTHAPGLIIAHDSEELTDLLRESCEEEGIAFEDFESLDDDRKYAIQEASTVDLTYTEAGYIASYEWAISLENPTRAELESFCYPGDLTWGRYSDDHVTLRKTTIA